MGRKQIAVVCDSCESPLRADSAFCPACGRPTRWATHDERVAWEVRQWRASRPRQAGAPAGTTMMLLRTEAGYEPALVDATDLYTWDRPLHPDRPQEQRPASPPPHPPAVIASEPNGNGHATVPSDDPPAPIVSPSIPAPQPAAADPRAATATLEVPDADRMTVSKKAIAVGIALAVGLPMSGKLLNLSGSRPEASRAPATAPARAAAGPIRPVSLVPARSGFAQVSPDAARFAVVIRNPNRGFAASGTAVMIQFRDATGRLIGSAYDRLGSIAPGGSIAVAGQAGVSGRVASLRTRVTVANFDRSRSVAPFVVRGTRMSRNGAGTVVRTTVAGRVPVRDARVVVVYLDRLGRIVGGDFVYVNVPSSPRTVAAFVSTSGLSGSVRRVEVYVLDPR